MNLDAENEVLPRAGVYAGRVRFLDAGTPAAGALFGAVTNVGRRPTFGASERVLTEAHLLDFSGDAYGRRIEITFEHALREERRFPGVDALRAQIALDAELARKKLGVR
jgi:riboflavin kinase/FMN adenylyltransferase